MLLNYRSIGFFSLAGVDLVRNLAKSAGMSDAGYDTMSDILYWGCVAGNTYAGYRALMPKGADLIRASNTASGTAAGASRAAKNASGNGKTSSASQKSNSPYKTLEKNGIPSTLSVAERETLDAGNYKMMYSGGNNSKPQRWIEAEAKLEKAATGQIGPTIDRNTGCEVGTIYVDSYNNAMISPKGGGITFGGYRGLDGHTTYPNGSAYQRNNPNGHFNSQGLNHGHGHLLGTGPSIDVYGNVVPYNIAEAHWQTYPRN